MSGGLRQNVAETLTRLWDSGVRLSVFFNPEVVSLPDKRKRVAVLMGGMSSEHEISLESGASVVQALDSAHYNVIPLTIARDGTWTFPGVAPVSVYEAVSKLQVLQLDCVFIALHGLYGEDGRIQGLLDILGLPYTGSGCAASALAMDKVRCKTVVEAQGIRVPRHVALNHATWSANRGVMCKSVERDIGFPCVVKPACQGSSVGMTIPDDMDSFMTSMDQAFAFDGSVLAEVHVPGREVTCSVLDCESNGLIRALAVTEIRPISAKFFDYMAKYTPGATEEITPARISQEFEERVKEISVHAHEIVGCAGWSRSDFIIDEEGPVWFEINTVPGLTELSLYPQAAAAADISFSDLVEMFVHGAIRVAKRNRESS